MKLLGLLPALALVAYVAPPSAVRADIIINWTNQTTSGLSAPESNVVIAAIDVWQSHVRTLGNSVGGRNTFDVTISPVTDAAVAYTTMFSQDGNGIPSSAFIGLSQQRLQGTDAPGFFVDPTPFDVAEFDASAVSTYRIAKAGGPAESKYDLFNVVLHELGHALGFTTDYALYQAAIAGADVNYGQGRTAQLAGDSENLAAHLLFNEAQPYDLMNSSFQLPTAGIGDRRLVGQLDLDILNGLYGYQVATVPEAPAVSLVGIGIAILAYGFRSRKLAPACRSVRQPPAKRLAG